MKSRKLKRDGAMPWLETNFSRLRNRILENAALARFNGALEEQELGQNYGGGMYISPEFVGLEMIQSIDAAKEHFTCTRAAEVRGLVELAGLQAAIGAVVHEGRLFRAKVGDSVVRTQPEVTSIIFENAVDVWVRQSVFLQKMGSLARAGLESVQPATRRANPEHAGFTFTFMHREYDIGA